MSSTIGHPLIPVAVMLASLLLPAPVTAGSRSGDPPEALEPDAAALLASVVHQEHCADAHASNPEVQSTALLTVAPAYGRVAESYRLHGAPHLLYWRGLLAQCIGNEAQAAQDLAAFVQAMAGDRAYAVQVHDARRRTKRFAVRDKPSGPGSPPAGGRLPVGSSEPSPILAAIAGGLFAGGAIAFGAAQSITDQRLRPALQCEVWRAADSGYQGPSCAQSADLATHRAGLMVGGSTSLALGLGALSVSFVFGGHGRTSRAPAAERGDSRDGLDD